MRQRAKWMFGGCLIVSLLAWTAGAVAAEGLDGFKLLRAIPADAMIAVNGRHHDGQAFLNEQFERVWAAVEKQHFDRDIKRLLKAMVEEDGGDVEAFDEQWRQMMDLAAGVQWSKLAKQEMAFGMKLGLPSGVDWVLLFVPPKDEVIADYQGLAAILEKLAGLDVGGGMTLSAEETEGNTVVRRLSLGNEMLPLTLTLARCDDVLLLGFGSSMPEQALALLRGESDAAVASLASTERFKAAFAKLPPPTDELAFIDVARLMGACRTFAQMAAGIGAMQPEEGGSESQPASPLAFLTTLVDEFNLWDYVASVARTEGMQTVTEEITVLQPDAKTKAFGKVFYGGKPLAEPLKYIPKEATGVSVGGGMDFQALYQAIVEFVGKEVPEGKALLTEWELRQEEMGFDVEEDLLAWIGGGYATFSAPIPTPFMPGWVLILEVKDEAKAAKTLEMISEQLTAMLGAQGAGVEDAKLPDIEGFKQVILPPAAMMIPGLGTPIFGLKDGHLFVANGPKVLTAALAVADGKQEGFDKNERFIAEGLPLGENVTGFAFQDLSGWANEVSQVLSMVGMLPMMAPDLAKNPVANTAIFIVSKAAKVVKELNFYRSKCTVTSFDGSTAYAKGVLHYQEPPKPRKAATAPTEAPAEEPEEAPAEGAGDGI